jgi:hypothetical protein
MFRNLDKPVLFNSVFNFEIEPTCSSGGLNGKVDIKFSTLIWFIRYVYF